MSSVDRPSISVIIPTHRRTIRLAMTLKALDHQEVPAGRFELIIVDDGNDPGRVPRVLETAGITLEAKIVASGQAGVSAARNLGAVQATGKIVLFLDDDTLLSQQTVARHIAAHEAPSRCVAHGQILDLVAFTTAVDGHFPCDRLTGSGEKTIALADMATLVASCKQLRKQASFIERTAAEVARSPGLYPACQWLLCIGTNTSMRIDDFWRVGGFDIEVGREWGGEDLELGIRLRAKGIQLQLMEATGYHLPEARLGYKQNLASAWKGIAKSHNDERLQHTACFLCGELSLREFDDLLRRPGANSRHSGQCSLETGE